MSEHPFFRGLGEQIGIATLAASTACIISSYAVAIYGQERINELMEEGYTFTEVYPKLVYFSIIALFSAMIVQHTYIVIIAARAAFYRYIPPVWLRHLFCLLLCCYWFFFALAEVLLVLALKSIRHNTQSQNMLILPCYSMVLVLLLTFLLHVIATRFRWGVSNLARVKRLSQSEVQSESLRECAICLDIPLMGDIIRRLPCQHVFHKMCVDQWLLKNPTCPSCKQPI